MKEKIKYIIVGLLIGFIAFPTIALGGTFTVSLVTGKGVKEAIQILAEQLDSLTGKVEVLSGQVNTISGQVNTIGSQVSKDELCQQAQALYTTLPPVQKDPATGQWIGRLMGFNNIVDLYNQTVSGGDPRDLVVIKQYYDKYMAAKAECDGQQ